MKRKIGFVLACGVRKPGSGILTCGSAAGACSNSGHPRCLCLGLCFTSSCVVSSSSWCCSGAVIAPRRSRSSCFGTRSRFCAVRPTGLI